MSFPYLFEDNFSSGDATNWTSETDGNSVLNIRHYSYTARQPYSVVPYRDAYMMEIDLVGADTNQYLQHDTGFDTVASATCGVLFNIYVTSDITMATTNRFTVLTLQSAGPIDEAVVDILYTTAGGLQIIASETGAGATYRSCNLSTDEWHTVELVTVVDSGGGNDGTIDFYVDGYKVGAQIATLDQGAIVQGRLGVIGVDAGTTAGKVYISDIISDDARVGPWPDRWENPRVVTKSGHFWVGPGCLESLKILTATADNVIKLFDTDTANVTRPEGQLVELDPDFLQEIIEPIRFYRGCYVELAGTSPKVHAKWVEDQIIPGQRGPVVTSDAAFKRQAFNRVDDV